MLKNLETDYLVVGAGATGMAFVDEIIHRANDVHVVLVDRLDSPGGHWNHAYPFVTLHQPALYYGVNSEQLGRGGADLVSKTEILDYYDRVIQKLVGTGRVSYFPRHEYRGDGHFVSMTEPGIEYQVKVRRRIVDSTYTNVTVPSTTPPNYEVDPDVALIPINGLAKLDRDWSRYVVIGAGKTGMDAILRLLERGVDPNQVTWVVSNDAWYIDRATAMPNQIAISMADQLRCVGQADSLQDIFLRQEARGHIMRLDESIQPTRYRCGTITKGELDLLRGIKDVVRMGRVVRIEPERLILKEGDRVMERDCLFVDCAADGLRRRPAIPVFDNKRITIQPVIFCQPAYSAAGIANVELRYDEDELKNQLCVPVPHPESPRDYPSTVLALSKNMESWGLRFPLWTLRSRLSAGSHMGLLHLLWFTIKSFWWRGRSHRKLRKFIAEMDEDH